MLAEPPRRRDEWHPDFPREDDRDGVRMAAKVTGWGPRRIVRRADGLVVGSVGFFGPPEPADDGVPEVEVGYGLVEAARGDGADAPRRSRACCGETDAARRARPRERTTRDNEASLASMRGAGFVVRDLLESPADPEREAHLVREPSP